MECENLDFVVSTLTDFVADGTAAELSCQEDGILDSFSKQSQA